MSTHKRRGTRGFVGLVAGVVSAGLLSAGLWMPAMGAASLPDHIVNGGFDYPQGDMFADSENGRSYILYREAVWAYVTAAGKHYNDHNKTGTVIAGFSQDQFGWRSNQPAMGGYPAGVVEVQESVDGAQRFAEIIAEDDQYTIYQDVRATPGSVMIWQLDHAPRGTKYTGGDEIQVMIGAPGHETVQTATRISNNGSADRVGETMTTIHTSKAGDKFAPFETYRGEYKVPAGVTTVRFTFKATNNGTTGRSGNLLDNVSFQIAQFLNYNANGGKGSMTSTQFLPNDKVTVAGNQFTRHGYTFTGWNTKADGSGTTYAPGAKPQLKTSMTLYAQWKANPASLSLNPNGGQGEVARIGGHTGERVSTSGKTPTRRGYTFTGWNTKLDGSGTNYDADSYYVLPAGDTVWYAKWTPNPSRIYYNLNGGEGDVPDTEGHVDERVNVTGSVPRRPGYTFTGWKDCNTDSVTMYHADSPITLPDGGVRLCAVWSPNPAQLVYDANSGTGSMSPTAGVTDGAVSVQPNQYQRDGYTFTGWNTSADGSGAAVLERSSIRLKAGTTTVYAQWQADPSSLKLDPNGGEGNPASIDGRTGETVTTEGRIPSRPGYTFTGWNTTPDGAGTAYPPVTSYLLPPTPTVWYAQWKANKAALAYNANGGDGTMSGTEGVVDGTVNVADNAFTRRGYTFTGWNTSADGTGKSMNAGEAVRLGVEPTVVYAQWQPNPATVTYDTGGADPIEPVTITDFTAPTPVTRTIPVKPHMTFTEWRYEDRSLFAGDPIPAKPGDNITLVAQYLPIKSRIIYNPNGGQGTMSDTTGNAGDTVPVADNQYTRRGYTFTGWNNPDGNSVKGSVQLPDEPLVLIAQWQPNTLTITYDPNGGEGDKVDVEGKYDQPVPTTDKINDWRKNCAKLTGWNTKPDGTGTAYTMQDGTLTSDGKPVLGQEDMTLYAQWAQQSCPQPQPAAQVEIPTPKQENHNPLATTGSSVLGLAAVGIIILLAAVGLYATKHNRK